MRILDVIAKLLFAHADQIRRFKSMKNPWISFSILRKHVCVSIKYVDDLMKCNQWDKKYVVQSDCN